MKINEVQHNIKFHCSAFAAVTQSLTDLTLALRSGEEREKAFIVYMQKLEGGIEERGGERQKHCAEARDVPEHTVTRKYSIRIPPAKTRS